MTFYRQEGARVQDETINKLISWSTNQPDIRAMLLTSTRAIPEAPTDAYSDYDVILVTTDVPGRYHNRSWLGDFGDVVIEYWDPLTSDETISATPTTSGIVYYPGTLKIDFTLWTPQEASAICAEPHLPAELDAGYQVLLDKDALTWPAPTGRGYRKELPTETEYLTLVSDFFIGVPYVITALIRGELLPAKWVLDYDMRYVYLLPMLEWRVLVDHTGPEETSRTALRFGVHGKGLRQHLPEGLWQQLETTYADMDPAANRRALHAMITLFREAAIVVGEAIGTAYPQHLHDRVLQHIAALEATT